MEAASEILEAKFQKAESDLNHLVRKLDVQSQQHAEGNQRNNPVELLRRVSAVKEEYKALVQEAAEIQKAQSEAMEFFSSQLPIAMQALQQLQQQVGMTGSDEDRAKVEELHNVLGLQVAQVAAHTVHSGDTEPSTDTAPSSDSNHALQPPANSAISDDGDNRVPQSPDCAADVLEDPVASRAVLRADSSEVVDIIKEEFESVSELIRGRVKLNDINVVYRSLFRHFKEDKNSQPLTSKDMDKMGLKVSGATGQAKLKVLRALKLLTISTKGEVKLL